MTAIHISDINNIPEITFEASGENMLCIKPDGFYVRGIRIPVDDREAQAVYNSFQQWLVWAHIQRQ
jgi:hypothetical protein